MKAVDVTPNSSAGLRIVEILVLWLTLKVVAFSIHENVVDQNDTEDAGPQMNVTEHKHKSNILRGEGGDTIHTKSWFIFIS